MNRVRILIAIPAGLLLAGCSLTPKYTRPEAPTPPAWNAEEQVQTQSGAPAAADVRWQDFVTDVKLRGVIQLALNNNRDLRVAALNVERVQALYRIQKAQQYPTIGASAGGDFYRVSPSLASNGQPYTYGQYTLSLGAASWEPDFFGRIRNLKSEALEQFLATQQARSAAQISLVAEVAATYLSMGADRDSLRLAEATLAAQKNTYELIRQTRDLGMASDVELTQARSQVQAAQVDIARYTGQLKLDENALNLLAGTPVPADLLPEGLGSDAALKEISEGLPSAVLLRRPDILMAEHQLKAANANIGVARASYFPQISLTAGGGLLSGSLSDLFKLGSRSWNFVPQLTVPIFDYGTRKASVRVSQVDRDTAIAEYEKSIQSAFREVSDSLSQRTWLLEQQTAQQSLVKTLEETYRLSDARYRAGMDSYLNVLVAQRSLYGGQQVLVSLRGARLINLVSLYKVLGGGA